MTINEILVAAKRNVDAGWVQGKYGSPEGCCARGAIMLATPSLPTVEFDYDAMDGATAALSGAIDGREIEPWNDEPWRTKDEVLAAFDKAIEATR